MDKKLRDTLKNYEKFKTKELYQTILFDDGKAPQNFNKTQLLVNRQQINNLLQEDMILEAENMRNMRLGALGTQPKYGFKLDGQIKERAEQILEAKSIDSRPDFKPTKEILLDKDPKCLEDPDLNSDTRDKIDNLQMANVLSKQKHKRQADSMHELPVDKAADQDKKNRSVSPKSVIYKSEGHYAGSEGELINDFGHASIDGKDHAEGESKTHWSQVTFNLSNLNYVKKRLFEPELVSIK